MKGIHVYEYKKFTVTFDFDEYTIGDIGIIPIDIWEEIQNDEEYRFLHKCLIAKFDFYKGIHSVYSDAFQQLLISYNDRYNQNNKEL